MILGYKKSMAPAEMRCFLERLEWNDMRRRVVTTHFPERAYEPPAQADVVKLQMVLSQRRLDQFVVQFMKDKPTPSVPIDDIILQKKNDLPLEKGNIRIVPPETADRFDPTELASMSALSSRHGRPALTAASRSQRACGTCRHTFHGKNQCSLCHESSDSSCCTSNCRRCLHAARKGATCAFCMDDGQQAESSSRMTCTPRCWKCGHPGTLMDHSSAGCAQCVV